LYSLGDQCDGNFEYSGNAKKIKNCTNCTFPHEPDNYDKINAVLKQINAEITRPSNRSKK